MGSIQVNTIKHLPLFSRSSTSSLANPLSTDSVSFKYLINPGFGGARHRCFVPFPSMPWVQSHRMTASYDTSWISTFVPIPHHCPPSSSPVIAAPTPDLRIALRYSLWHKLTLHFQLSETRSKLSGLSIPRSRFSSLKQQHLPRFSMASITTGLFTLRATGPLRRINHSRLDSNFTETSASRYLRSYAQICPLQNSHFSQPVTLLR